VAASKMEKPATKPVDVLVAKTPMLNRSQESRALVKSKSLLSAIVKRPNV